MDEATFRSKLVARQLTRVWGQGACSLINRRVLEAGLISRRADFPQVGLNAGETEIFASSGTIAPDLWRTISPTYFMCITGRRRAPHPGNAGRLGQVHPQSPKLGDLVNVVLTALEPLPQRAPTVHSMDAYTAAACRGRWALLRCCPN